MNIDPKKFKAYNLIEFDENERAICEIKKHRFGLVMIFIFGIVISLLVMFSGIALSLWLENDGLTNGNQTTSRAVLIAGAVLTALVLLVSAVYAYIFGHNVMLVTSDKIAQVIYRGPLDRKISQLNISDVQDVTISQRGILSRLLNFGTLVVETAGEQQNYTFTYAADPHYCAKEIMSAREHSISKFGN